MKMPKILVVEDEKTLLNNILSILSYEGFETIGAENGLIGLQLAYEHTPDLIVSDVMMPEISGYELLSELRQDLATATIPFIFLTAKSETEDRRKGMNLGADDYLSKPFSHTDLLAAVRTQLEKRTTLETRQLRNFAQKLVAVHDTERRDLADKLHNDISQLLTSLKLTLNMTSHIPPESLPRTLDDAQRLIETTLQSINDLSADLYPSPLDHLGLLPALFWQLERFTQRTNIHIDFQHDALNLDFPPDVKIAVYRIIQEALANIALHADTDAAALQIWLEDDRLNLQIIDDGIGFNIEQLLTTEVSGGLTEINERVIALNGQITVSSAPDKGTQIFARLPITTPHKKQTIIPVHSFPPSSFKTVSPLPQPSKAQIATLIAEPIAANRTELEKQLATQPNISVVGSVSTVHEIFDFIEKETIPHIIIVNIALTIPNNADFIAQLANDLPSIKILILSSYPDEAYAAEMFRNGAHGYLLRDTIATELVLAIHTLQVDQYYLAKTLSQSTIETFINHHKASSELDAYTSLTNREREILQLILDGNTNVQIADQLVLSPRTVETHRANMMRKLDVHNQTELMHYALRRGLLSAGG